MSKTIIKTNVELYIEHINESISTEKMAQKYNLSLSVMEAILSYGREEHRNTNYWNRYLKNIVNKNNTITL